MKAVLLLLLIGALYFNWRQFSTNKALITAKKHSDSVLDQRASANLSNAAVRFGQHIRNPWKSPCTMAQRGSFLSILKGIEKDSFDPSKKIKLINYALALNKEMGDSSNFYPRMFEVKLRGDSAVNQPFNPILAKLQMVEILDLLVKEVFRYREGWKQVPQILFPLTYQNETSGDYEALFFPYVDIYSPKEAIVYLNNKPLPYSDGIYNIKFTKPSKGKHTFKITTVLPITNKDTTRREMEYYFRID